MYSASSWSALVGKASTVGPASQGVVVEASRRVVKAQEDSERSATQLGKRIWWLNLWLLVFTVALFLLTGVLVWTALREVGDARRQSTDAAPTSRAGSAWVLWSTFPTASEPQFEYRPREAFEKKAECDAAKRKVEQTQFDEALYYEKRGLENTHSNWGHRCLPDTVEPRGPKGSK